MTDVGMRPQAVDTLRVGQENADIVQQRRLFQKRQVDIQFRMLSGQRQCLVGHRAAMHQEDMFQFVVLRIILVDDS